jgi:hypothetical protein
MTGPIADMVPTRAIRDSNGFRTNLAGGMQSLHALWRKAVKLVKVEHEI